MNKKDDNREKKIKRIKRFKEKAQRIKEMMSQAPFDPYVRRCKITKVIDGDTVRCIIDLGYNNYSKHSIRLLGIDTMELRDKNPNKKKLAYEAKDFVSNWVNTSASTVEDSLRGQEYMFTIESQKADSFGRWLGTIKNLEGESLGQALLEAGLAVEYRK